MNVMKEKDIVESLKSLFRTIGNGEPLSMVKIAESGSDRCYYRLSSDDWSCIGTYVPDAAEGKCFVELAHDFKTAGCEVPEIYAVSPDSHFYLQEDLGDKSLFSILSSPDSSEVVRQTLSRLIKLQRTPLDSWRHHSMYGDFSRRQVMWDLNYFKYEFLKPKNVMFDEDCLEDDFETLSSRLTSVRWDFWGFMMRDCQSRNVMLTSHGPVFIDFQGGRFGPSLYDAVSLLWQARAQFSHEFRMSMLDSYADYYCDGDAGRKKEMLSVLDDMVLFRTLQVLGAYGFRGLVQHKSHFLLSIPAAIGNLEQLLNKGAIDLYPELKKAAYSLIEDASSNIFSEKGRLVVEIFSFSYKKGYPQDRSGNGGGFMFDCRAMKNPGRFKEYKNLTGKDREVSDFLIKCGEVGAFLRSAWSLTDPAIERYISRGFSHLQIGFGCTGGQHRSVYCAEQTAGHVRALFPDAEVVLIHRETPNSLS